jgi:HEPN domain-containing protein
MKPFRPEHYFRAALERMRQAQFLYQDGDSFALAMYIAGLAVECMLRAFKGKRDPTFDEKHDLRRLFTASGLLYLDPADFERRGLSQAEIKEYAHELRAGVTEIYLLWSNDYRYAAEERLRAHLKKIGELRRGIKGDLLKANARRLLTAAERFINRGARLWTS